MSKAKFTKGEWSIKEAAPLTCAWTFDFEKMNLGVSIENEEFEANTSLIASAPEMYDILHSIENDDDKIPPFLWDKIQAVLSKARGEG